MRAGALSVMITGQPKMPKWPADSWGILPQVIRQFSFTKLKSQKPLHCYFAGSIAYIFARFGQGTGPILLDDLLCTSRETRLIDCPNRGIGVHNCRHYEDAGVRCQRKLQLISSHYNCDKSSYYIATLSTCTMEIGFRQNDTFVFSDLNFVLHFVKKFSMAVYHGIRQYAICRDGPEKNDGHIKKCTNDTLEMSM